MSDISVIDALENVNLSPLFNFYATVVARVVLALELCERIVTIYETPTMCRALC